MGKAKAIVLKPIKSRRAAEFVRRHHYSGKVVNNSTLHVGVFYSGALHGVMQFGSPLDKRKVLGLVRGTGWNQMLELNRMAFDDVLPRNSESRAVAVCFRLLKKHRPDVKWVLSFADGTQCGDGAIYRASGFVLTGIKPSANIADIPGAGVIHKMTLESNPTAARAWMDGRSYFAVTGGKYDFAGFVRTMGGKILQGAQFRYIAILDKAWRSRLAVPTIDFADIPRKYRIYKGQRAHLVDSDACASPIEGPTVLGRDEGAEPILALHGGDHVEA